MGSCFKRTPGLDKSSEGFDVFPVPSTGTDESRGHITSVDV